jgi:hypothetical protein
LKKHFNKILRQLSPVLLLLSLTGVAGAQTDTTPIPAALQDGFDRILKMADEAQRMFDSSFAPQINGAAYNIPARPSWQILPLAGKQSPPSLKIQIAGSGAGSISLELPSAVSYRKSPGSSQYRLDSLPPAAWIFNGNSSASYNNSVTGTLNLNCRVDCVGPVINYRFDLENTGEDSLFDLTILVPVELEKLIPFSGVIPLKDSSRLQIGDNSLLGRIRLFSSGTWISLGKVLQDTGLDKSIFLPFGPAGENNPLLSGIFGGNHNLPADISLQGNTIYVLSENNQWRMDFSVSPAVSFCFEPVPFRLYLNPGIAVLAPNEKTSAGGLVTLSPIR